MQVLKAIRVKHWLKNGLVFLPIIFSGRLTDSHLLLVSVISFFSFSFMASAIYLLNDIHDKDADAQHPRKRTRPIASGAVSVPLAAALAVVLAVLSCVICGVVAVQSIPALSVVMAYGLINIGYSLKWKDIPVIDVTVLSLGFLLRVLFGGYFCGVAVSQWLCLSILAMSFFFALGKRRGELRRFGSSMRPSLEHYTVEFFDKSMYVFMAAGIVFYSLWLFDRMEGSMEGSLWMPIVLSVCVVIAVVVCLRYCLDIETNASDGDPVEVVFSDKVLLASVFLWLIIMIGLLYLLL